MVLLSSPPAPSTPIVNDAYLYISGCNISVASTTVLGIQPGQARDSSNTIDIRVWMPLFINSAVNGINGLDEGTIAASSQYAVYLIASSNSVYSSNTDVGGGPLNFFPPFVPFARENVPPEFPVNPFPVGAILSLTSNVSPVLPFGYDAVRLLGFIETDPSSHFVQATHEPQLMAQSLGYPLQPPVSVLSGGDATTWTLVNCSAAVPSGALPNVILYLLVTFIPAAVGDVVQFSPVASPPANAKLATVTGLRANFAQTQFLQIYAGVSGGACAFWYEVSSASDSVSVSVLGWVGAPHVAYPV